jgi:hypothetical protein
MDFLPEYAIVFKADIEFDSNVILRNAQGEEPRGRWYPAKGPKEMYIKLVLEGRHAHWFYHKCRSKYVEWSKINETCEYTPAGVAIDRTLVSGRVFDKQSEALALLWDYI